MSIWMLERNFELSSPSAVIPGMIIVVWALEQVEGKN
jgi:hypothetical protein